MPLPNSEVWYIGGHSQKGFTDNPEHAKRDRWGNAVVAPGEVQKVWRAVYKDQSNRREKIWERLLDRMEELYDAKSKQQPYQSVLSEMNGLIFALTVLTGLTVEEVRKGAKRRYSEESEG